MSEIVVVLGIINGIIIITLLNKTTKVSRNKELQDKYNSLKVINKNALENNKNYDIHIEIIDELIKNNKYKEAKDYIEVIYSGIEKMRRVSTTKLSALNSLLQVKFQQGLDRNINVSVNISTNLVDFKFEEWQLCRVIANIIDNAYYELENVGDKQLEVNISEDKGIYKFEIMNTGSEISKDQLKNIFKVGFTTKKDRGDGMGLYIVKNILNDWQSNIKVDTNQSRTIFIVEIPKI